MKKTFEWITTGGQKGKIVAEYSMTMQERTSDLDGHIINLDAKPSTTGLTNMVAYIDDVQVDSCSMPEFWELIDVRQPGIKKIHGLKIGFTAAYAEKYEAFLVQLMEDGKSDEVKSYYAKQNQKEVAKKIEDAKETIQKAEAQTDIPTIAVAKKRLTAYNNLYNEGGEGYLPTIITLEEYELAKKTLESHQAH